MSNYRLWQSNGDFSAEGRPEREVASDVASEMGMCTGAILVTLANLSKEQSLKAVDHIRWLIESSDV